MTAYDTELLSGDERIRVLHWMSRIEYRNHHEDLSKGLLDQSGQWLLESKHFIEWGQSSVSSILWLHGIRKRPSHSTIHLRLTKYSWFGED